MTSPSPFDAPDIPRAPSTPDAVPTWRDLPLEPPYGPVLPPRTPNVGRVFAPVLVEEGSRVTPSQIALAVGGIVILAVIGIGAALLLLGDEDPAVAEAPAATEDAPAEQGTLEPLPPATAPPATAPQPLPAPDAPQGELLPEDPGNGQSETPDPQTPDASELPEGDGDPGIAPDPFPTRPGATDAPTPEEGEEVELPRLFRLRTLPSGTEEDATTVRQTTTQDDEVVTEQVTTLVAEGGEVIVRATRGPDVAATLAEVQASEGAEEVSVLGLPGYLVDGVRLAYLLPGQVETLVEVEGPEGLGTEALLTIAQGLELLR